MKRRWKISIITLAVIFGGGGISLLAIHLYNPYIIPAIINATDKRAYISDEDFDKCLEDFEVIADMAIQYSEKHKNEKYYLYVDYSPDIVYESIDDAPIDISEAVQKSLLRVSEAFNRREGELDRIKVDNSFVTIQIGNHRFAVVYSRDGTKPKYIPELEDRGYSFYTRKVHDNWYFVTGT